MKLSTQNKALIIHGYCLGMQAPADIIKYIEEIIEATGSAPRQDIEISAGIQLVDAKTVAAAIQHAARNGIKSSYPAPAAAPLAAIDQGDFIADTHTRAPEAAEDPDRPAEQPKQKGFKRKLDPQKHLIEIQTRHDERESNGSIAKDFDVSDQTIVNFLKKYGTYSPIDHGRRSTTMKPAESADESDEAPDGISDESIDKNKEPAPIEIKSKGRTVGDRSSSVRANSSPERLIEKHREYVGQREIGEGLSDSDWPDIRQMIVDDIPKRKIADDYGVKVNDLHIFIARMQEQQEQYPTSANRNVRPAKAANHPPMDFGRDNVKNPSF